MWRHDPQHQPPAEHRGRNAARRRRNRPRRFAQPCSPWAPSRPCRSLSPALNWQLSSQRRPPSLAAIGGGAGTGLLKWALPSSQGWGLGSQVWQPRPPARNCMPALPSSRCCRTGFLPGPSRGLLPPAVPEATCPGYPRRGLPPRTRRRLPLQESTDAEPAGRSPAGQESSASESDAPGRPEHGAVGRSNNRDSADRGAGDPGAGNAR